MSGPDRQITAEAPALHIPALVLDADPGPALALWEELRWARVLLDVHTRRLQRAGLLPADDGLAPGRVITPAEIAARRRAALADAPLVPLDLGPSDAAELAQAQARYLRARPAPAGDGPLDVVCRRFGLGATERLLLVLAAAPELEPSFARRFAFLNDHVDRPHPTLGLVAQALLPEGGAMLLRGLLEPDAPLVRAGLVRLGGSPATPLLERPLVPEPRVVRYLLGATGLDPALDGVAVLRPADAGLPRLVLGAAERAKLTALTTLVEAHATRPEALPVLVLRGAEGAGRERWAHALAERLGLPTLTVNIQALVAHAGDLASALSQALREARLLGAMVCLRQLERVAERAAHADAAPGGDDPEALARALDRALRGHPTPLALLAAPTWRHLPRVARGLEVVDLALPDRPTAARLWQRALAPEIAAGRVDLELVARTVRATPGQIAAAVDEARRRAGGATTLAVLAAAREALRMRMGPQVQFVEPRASFADLVLPATTLLQLRELVARYRHHDTVLRQWRFGQRFGEDLGLSALFEGPPGTGKTMAASVVARELGLDLYRVDLSSVVSKYVGETEKNLGRVFDEAERARAVVLFDEADSLFAKRTAVSSANDRYANLEVNYLLQRLEAFTGIAILTTNFPESIDAAFSRRLSLRVAFPKPGLDERTALWRTMLAGSDALEPAVDLAGLASEFDISGGHIRNAVLRAAFIAASRERHISQAILRVSARIECKQQGMLVQGDPLAELGALQ